jgi:hypothetical protein
MAKLPRSSLRTRFVLSERLPKLALRATPVMQATKSRLAGPLQLFKSTPARKVVLFFVKLKGCALFLAASF